MKNKFLSSLLLLALSCPLSISAQGISDAVAQKYQEACQSATQWLEQWQSDVVVFPTQLKSNYTKLKNALEAEVDMQDEAAVKSATTKINNAINSFQTSANNSKNTQKAVSKTKFDPNFHIYLCFGQSNMEGNATPELEDYSGSSERFLTMAAVNMSTHSRTKGKWYVARPPLCRDWTGLTPADYFGKTLIKQLPDSISVGVINVALGGCAIEMFLYQGTELKNYLTKQADWLQGYARDYNNEPYDQLIALAKQAQKVGVIHGILLHQGCSNNTQQDWPNKVNTIYQRMLRDLNLSQDEVPLLIGELLSQAQGGACWGHNSVIAKCPGIIANSHVVSSKDCPGASDNLHFTAQGYRMIGANYANVMRPLLDRYIPNYSFSVRSLSAKESTVVMPLSAKKSLTLTLTDADGKKHDVTAGCTFNCSDPDLLSFSGVQVTSKAKEGDATVTATYTNDKGEEVSTEFTVSVRIFPLTAEYFNPSLLKTGTFTRTNTVCTFKAETSGVMGGWKFENPVDLSAYHYLVVDLAAKAPTKQTLRIYDTADVNSESYYSLTTAGMSQIVVPLDSMQTAAGKVISSSKVSIVGFVSGGSAQSLRIKNIYLANEDPTFIRETQQNALPQESAWYDLSGRRTAPTRPGVYVKDGRKILK